MKKILLLVFVTVVNMQAQWEVSASIGVNFTNMPQLREYLNKNYFLNENSLNEYLPAFETGIEAGYQPYKNFQFACEIKYEHNKYFGSLVEPGRFSYDFYQPSFIGYYLLKGKNYLFKFGGGIGPRFVSATLPYGPRQALKYIDYKGIGYGFLGKIEGLTLLGNNIFAHLDFDLRYNKYGNLSDSGGENLISNVTGKALTLNAFSFGVKTGLAIKF